VTEAAANPATEHAIFATAATAVRIQSSDAVLNQASAVVKTIVDTYSEPNRLLVEV
jgi:hypothetical protein